MRRAALVLALCCGALSAFAQGLGSGNAPDQGTTQTLTLASGSTGPVASAANPSGVIATSGFQSVQWQFLSASSTNNDYFEESSDGSTWSANKACIRTDVIAPTLNPDFTTGQGTIVCPVHLLYQRLRVQVSSSAVSVLVTPRAVPFLGPPNLGYNATMPMRSSEVGSSSTSDGVTPVVAQSATSLLGKGSAGNLYGASAMLVAAANAQTYLVVINANAVPSSGAAITPVDAAAFPSNAVGAAAIIPGLSPGPPNAYSSGIVLLITTSLTSYTPGANAFAQVRVR